MPARTPRATPVRADNLALLHVLEATIETLKAENEILKRQLAAAETRAAQAVITKRLDALAADRLDQLAAERARPWWRQAANSPATAAKNAERCP
jgi:hypothetical protein